MDIGFSVVTIPELKIIQTQGGQISYREKGSGPPLLLMHGIGGNSQSWRVQLETLSEFFYVIAWDAPGYGKSLGREASLSEYARAVIDFLDTLKIPKVNLLGHSMGGIIAQGVANLNPQSVNKLILSSTFMGYGAPLGSRLGKSYLSRLRDIKTMSSIDFGRARAASMVAKSTSNAIREEITLIASEVTYSGLLSGCKMIHHADTRRMVSVFEMPVLVLTGKQDSVVKPYRSEEMAALIPNAKQKQLMRVGHAGYLEDPFEFNSVIRRFLI